MNSYSQLIEYIRNECSDNCDIETDVDMSKHTTFRIGGKADIALYPHTTEALCCVIDRLREHDIRYVVIGNASNVLFADEGYHGAVVFTTAMNNVAITDDLLICDAGAPLTATAQNAVRRGYDGYAFACGIPGSIGGAVFMNAGAYEGQISDILVYSEYYEPSTRTICRIDISAHDYAYRHSVYCGTDRVITRAAFALKKADNPSDVLALMEEHIKARNSKQPLEYPSAGSVFKRYPGYYTAQLIDEAGLKGVSIGGAQVSSKHAGFIVNRGNAKAKDVLDLIELIKKRIFVNKGIHIECEVRYID